MVEGELVDAPTRCKHSLGTSCVAGPWLVARAGRGLPSGIHRPAGQSGSIPGPQVDVSGLRSQALSDPLPVTPALFLFVTLKSRSYVYMLQKSILCACLCVCARVCV